MSERHPRQPKPTGRVGTVLNGKWQIDRRIGSGGMSTVYACTHRNGMRAAIKVLHEQFSRHADTRARFQREGYVANAVGHPGVVQVLDDDVAEDGSAFLVLELLEGETMENKRLRLGGALPLDEVLDIADFALDALSAAHEKDIVHRDIKPDNVFLTTDGRVKLLDFGLARMKDSQGESTQTGVRIGTPEFMPPEQALGLRDVVDSRSDVWGLGATMFTSITGKYVHEATTLRDQLTASATQRARGLRTVAIEVPPAVAAIVDRALELEKSDRWPSAREMQSALRSARVPATSSGPPTAPLESPRELTEPALELTALAPAPRLDQTLFMANAPVQTTPMVAPLSAQMPHPSSHEAPFAGPYTQRMNSPVFSQHPSQPRVPVDPSYRASYAPPQPMVPISPRSALPPSSRLPASAKPASVRGFARGIVFVAIAIVVLAALGVGYLVWRGSFSRFG